MLQHNVRKCFLEPKATKEQFRNCSPLNPQLSIHRPAPNIHVLGAALWRALETARETHLKSLGPCFIQVARASNSITKLGNSLFRQNIKYE